MVKIRLRRVGAKKQPHYRVVVTDSSTPRDGRFIETIGHYNPRTEPPTVEVDAERALYWLSVGAQPSAAVQRMLDKMGIMSRVEAVRKGEVSIEELVEQMRSAEVEPEPQPVEADELEEETVLEEAEDLEAEEEEAVLEEAEDLEAEEEEDEDLDLDAEAELADEDDWSESDEDEDADSESDYDLDAEEADDIDEE
jgi:small subunit ribosomal protein S16